MASNAIHANVLLLDDKIINWKTSRTTSWDTLDSASLNRQPLNLFCLENRDKLSVKTKDVESFESAEKWYRTFDIHENYPKSMYLPYEPEVPNEV